MFDPELYPTPIEVIQAMGFDPRGKRILEPSAGSGNIVDYCLANGAKSVVACEHNEKLRSMLATKCSVIESDFLNLTAERVSHIDMIVMNPPFSQGEKHILHAFEIATDGCEIYALCNANTVLLSERYKKLAALIQFHGSATLLGSCFKDSERKTDVEIALVVLKKGVKQDSTFNDYFDMTDDFDQREIDGVIKYDEVHAEVSKYRFAKKALEEMFKAQNSMAAIGYEVRVICTKFRTDAYQTPAEALKEMQKIAWRKIFTRLDMTKNVTSNVLKDINKFIEEQYHVPFTVKNVYKMLDIIIQTRSQVMSRALKEAIDNFTMYTKENRYNFEGWKTNKGYMLNRKFICYAKHEYTDRIAEFSANGKRIDDLLKVICFLTSRDYNKLSDSTFRKTFSIGEWHKIEDLFEVKLFKKGTVHFKFQKEQDWAILNIEYAKLHGLTLPEKF